MKLEPIREKDKESSPEPSKRMAVTFESQGDAEGVAYINGLMPVSWLGIRALFIASRTRRKASYPKTISTSRKSVEKVTSELAAALDEPEATASPERASLRVLHGVFIDATSQEGLSRQAAKAAWQVEPHSVPADLTDEGIPRGHIANMAESLEI